LLARKEKRKETNAKPIYWMLLLLYVVWYKNEDAVMIERFVPKYDG